MPFSFFSIKTASSASSSSIASRRRPFLLASLASLIGQVSYTSVLCAFAPSTVTAFTTSARSSFSFPSRSHSSPRAVAASFLARTSSLLVLAAAQKPSSAEGPNSSSFVRNIFTDVAERRKKEEASAALIEKEDQKEREESRRRMAASSSSGSTQSSQDRNVLGGPLEICSVDPMTGFTREGCCTTGPQDLGSHTVCSIVTDDFLRYSRNKGNDLITPRPQYRFPGLKAGDRWCLCASRWQEAFLEGVAPSVVLRATHFKALEHCQLQDLLAHAVDPPEEEEGASTGGEGGRPQGEL